MKKNCKSCLLDKEEHEFKLYKSRKNRGNICYNCELKNSREYKKKHAKEIKEKRKIYLKDNAEHIKQRYKKYCENNREKLNQIAKKYRNDHIGSKLRDNLGKRLREKLKKNKLTTYYLGTKINIIKEWLEYNFTKEMNWDNYGTLWHIDHVFPIAKYNLENKDHISNCFNWKNLYPMNAFDNKSKSNKIEYNRIVFQELKIKHFCTQNKIKDDVTDYFKKYNYIATHLEAGNPLEH